MQRIIILCVFIVLNQSSIKACNVCSCTSMGNSIGILPQFKSHFIGIRETYRQFESVHPVSILNPLATKSQEKYFNTELWGRWYPHPKIQVFGFIPINRFSKTDKQVNTTIQGLGDISVLANYILLNTGDSSSTKFKQVLSIGSGFKFSSGRYNSSEFANFQLGAGSKDVLFNASYTIRYQKLGLMSELNYRLNGSNSSAYQFGNKLSVNERFFYFLNLKKVAFMAYSGFTFEKSNPDNQNNIQQSYTGGTARYLQIGMDAYKGKFQFGASGIIPIQQNLGEGQIKEFPRIQINTIFYFNKKTNVKSKK